MRAIVRPGNFTGTFRIPASKSHTIRRLLIATLAEGESFIEHPLDSLDTQSCMQICRALGADIECIYADDDSSPNPVVPGKGKLVRLSVKGLGIGAGGKFRGTDKALDTGNSGTTLFLSMAISALGDRLFCFTGDSQIEQRSAAELLGALNGLGAKAVSARGNGCVPISIQGPLRGGRISLSCPTSQYLSGLLLAAPLAPKGTVTEIDVPLLNEKPYIGMTLSYLDSQGIKYKAKNDYSYFRIEGGSAYKPVNGPVPGDFSSAAFPACAAAVSGGPVTLLGLNPHDTQGDKEIFRYLVRMGCHVEWIGSGLSDTQGGMNTNEEWELLISRPGELKGQEFDLNASPDMLPALAATAAFASGETGLVNVAHARMKETDRVSVMAAELKKLGAVIEELSDGLIIRGKGGQGVSMLHKGKVNGRGDHRIVMALAVAALGADGPVEIDTAESVNITYPGFFDMLGAKVLE